MSKTNNGLSLKETIKIASEFTGDSFALDGDTVTYAEADAKATYDLYHNLLEREETIQNQLEFYHDKDLVTLNQAEVLLEAFESGYLMRQYSRDGDMYLNPNGIVTRAEAINALTVGGESKDSFDGVSVETDFFNKGYNELVDNESSNFYNVYQKNDLDLNIRRFELAYILASHKGYQFGKDEQLEFRIPDLYQYEDVVNLPMMLGASNGIDGLLPKSKDSIESYIGKVKTGKVKLPLNLVVLTSNLMQAIRSEVDLTSLHPLKGVSRLELALILDKLN